MEKLILLGTGNALVTKCYNTCFIIQREDENFLVDTGGGNGILTQLEKANISICSIHNIFVSHEHSDHLLGIVWLVRIIATRMKKGEYEGDLHIYCHKELIETSLTIIRLTVQGKFVQLIGERIFFHCVEDQEEKEIMGYAIQFFDIQSTKVKQFGFAMKLHSGKRLTFLGDEPYRDCEYAYAYQTDYLLHEAFCRYVDKDIFQPYEKHHATVKDGCETATKLEAKNIILYHTEDKRLHARKEEYMREGQEYFAGNIFVPDDLDVIVLE